MNKSSARSAVARASAFLFVLVAAAGAQTYSILTSFDGTNGQYPSAMPLVDDFGNMFGTTEKRRGSDNCGAVYELVNNGGGSYTNKTLYKFPGNDDGCAPFGGLVMDSGGNLYGTAGGDNAYPAGVVYELVNHGGGSYAFELIYAFSVKGKGGYAPVGDLAMFKRSLYGVTSEGVGGGCTDGCGTLYRLTKSGGKWVETMLHVFYARSIAGVTFDSSGNIYGTTYQGGSFGYGTVFKLSPQSSGSYKETNLHSFDGMADGCHIESGVVLDSAGNLYGTAAYCGANGDGTVYQLQRSGSKYGFRVILAFNGTNGVYPLDQLGHVAVDSAGNIYGTASIGGAYNWGTVFKLAAGSFLYTDLHDFNKNGTDGYFPLGGVSLDSLGNLYGTTSVGGSNGDGSDGTVWQIANP